MSVHALIMIPDDEIAAECRRAFADGSFRVVVVTSWREARFALACDTSELVCYPSSERYEGTHFAVRGVKGLVELGDLSGMDTVDGITRRLPSLLKLGRAHSGSLQLTPEEVDLDPKIRKR